ncbi:MAG: 23S rRNA (guanosine(2251)-2'-O)-methyltransferase RlmB [Paludibacteraceae bacterium]|nr:23S rRNA (guanosine(2251)-2'-O)-methyltransferase RlmB [Paludibacteraceae bacterium]
MVFGIRAVIEAINAGKDFDRILLRRDMSSSIARELLEALKGKEISVQRVPREKLDRMTEKNHQGVIAFLSQITYQKIEDIVPFVFEQGKVPFFVILDGITDVRNFGAIARTCECAGVDAIIIPTQGAASINADAIKTSAGALHNIAVCRTENLTSCIKFLAESGIKSIAATEKATQNYTQCPMTDPIALIMGAEDVGIDPERLKLCDEQVRIPMSGKISSLNVSVSAGILIYEVLRQREIF